MNTLDERLANRLHDMIDGEPDSAPPVGALLDRGRRARRRRTSTLVSGTFALLALGAVGVATAVTAPASDRPGVTAEATRPGSAAPEMELASAVTASENLSYRMRLTNSGPGGLTYEGAFDPRTDTGYVRAPQDDSTMVELLINGTRYTGGELPPGGKLPAGSEGLTEKFGRYGEHPGKYDRLSLYDGGDGVLGAASADPAALFAALKSANATITGNADGTLHFAFATMEEKGSTSTAGDVTLDRDGRIATVTLTVTWQSTEKGRLDQGTVRSKLELFDYGVPVTVERPADVVKVNE
jgi:hypothetical protein